MSVDKIKTIEELAEIRASYAHNDYPDRVVLAHGVFDVIHPGHIRHLQAARKFGTTLWATITADQYVNKGPGHPVFSQHLRAEQIAALECVEYVAVHNDPAAPIDQIKPHFYVRGDEYEKPDNDITGKIVIERELVEKYGGKLVFTHEITFSSSEILNRYVDGIYDPPLRALLKQYRTENAIANIMDLFAKVEDDVWVIAGELILDHYVYAKTLHAKAAKENILAVQYINEETFAGGVIAAANHLAGFVREVRVITTIGDDRQYVETLRLLKTSLRRNVRLYFTVRDDQPTTRKTRIVDKSYTRKLFEIYTDGPPHYDEKTQKILIEDIGKALDGANGLIVLDYGHGMFMPDVIEACKRANFLAVNAQANAGNYGYNVITKYPGAQYACLDAPEARLATRDRVADLSYVIEKLAQKLGECPKIIVTTGAEGCIAYDTTAPRMVEIPAFNQKPVDTIGAGDAFFVGTTPLMAAGGRIDLVAFVGNMIAALKIGTVGHRQYVKKVDLVRALGGLLK